MSRGRGRWHLQGALWRYQQRPERQLDFSGWRIPVSDLWECVEAGGVRHETGRLAGGGYQCRHPLQQPGGVGGILMPSEGATSPAAIGCCRRNTSTASRFWRDQQELERGVEIMRRALALFM